MNWSPIQGVFPPWIGSGLTENMARIKWLLNVAVNVILYHQLGTAIKSYMNKYYKSITV